ncbi:MAG: hypothetical protein Q8L14_42715 [Myxococcales bacterium]|nr:hypothetical protein [Myxococcales bacterium]
MRSRLWPVLMVCVLSACPRPPMDSPVDGGSDQPLDDGGSTLPPDAGIVRTVTIGGTVEGLDPTFGALTLSLNGGEVVSVAAPGPFIFTTRLAEQTPYTVTLVTSPAEQRCELENATGVTQTADISTVRVRCTTRTSVLQGVARGVDRQGLSLRESVSQQLLTLPIDAGAFAFPTPVEFGQRYQVTVDSTPVGRDCGLDGGTGVVDAGVTFFEVSCAVRRVPLSVELQGVDVDGVTLTERGSNQVLTTTAGADAGAFPSPLLWESTYDVLVSAPPASGRTCSIDGGTGTVLGPIPPPVVSCVKQRFQVGGTISGLDAGSVRLRENTTMQQVTANAGATSFVLPAPVEWDTPIDVVIAAQPPTRFCVLDGGSRVVRSTITDIAVACRGGFPVSGLVRNLRGAGLQLAERGTAQTITIAPDGGTTAFQLPVVVPEGDALQLSIATQPAGQTCRFEAPVGPVNGPIPSVLLTCGASTSDLVINEVGSFPGPTMPFWVELYNGTPTSIPLAAYSLRTASRILADAGEGPVTDFDLPDASVPSGGYFVVSGKPIVDLHDAPTVRFLVQNGLTLVPGISLELRSRDAGVDTVLFDGGTGADGWSGAPLLLPTTATDFGRSLARTQTPDTNGAADFPTCDFPTPAGLNDVCVSADTDADGLPDVAEVAGSTWNELPLFDWGARVSQKDVFVEIDWVSPTGFNGTLDPGILPRREALERMEQVFRARGVFVHFDTGELFDPAPGINPANFDLGGGNQQPWACTVTLSNVAGATSFHRLKATHADVRRRLAFHYSMFTNALGDVTCANSGNGVTGNAELPGNDFAIALGRSGLSLGSQNGINQTINWQSATFMHELGHNLGLRHGGFEDANYKPNYLSVMNYYYQNDGLPVLGMNEGDRYFREYVLYGTCSGPPGLTSAAQLNRNRFSATFALDYSNGTSIPLNEAALVESTGFGRMGSGPVDFNWNTVIDTMPVTANLNALNTLPRVCPRVAGGNEVLLDHNDWAALSFTFTRSARGSASGPPRLLRRPDVKDEEPVDPPFFDPVDFFGDHQPVADESPLVRELP